MGLLFSEGKNPLIHGRIPHNLAAGHILCPHEGILPHLPAVCIVLKQPDSLALHDFVIAMVFQNHSNQRRAGNEFHHPVGNRLEISLFADFRSKTRSVVVEYLKQLFPRPLRTIHRCINCQIAALGMSSRIKITCHISCHPVHILHRQLLRVKGLRKGEIHIFLPPNNRRIGSPVSNIYIFILQDICHGRKLGLLHFIDDIDIVIHFNRTKSDRLGCRCKKFFVFFLIPIVF